MPLLVIVAAAAVALGVTLLVVGLMPRQADPRRLVATNLERGELTSLREIELTASARERAVQPLLGSIASFARRFTPAGSIATLERKHVLAGRPSALTLERLLAAKIIFGTVGVMLVVSRLLSGASGRMLLVAIAFAVLLYFTPDVVIRARAAERQRAILQDLPDTLDQITICMEAGIGFEAAIVRSTRASDAPLAQELVRTLQEIQVGVGRRAALTALADRNDVPDLRHFVTALLQAESYGVPIARVLHDQASELRAKRRQRAEEAARKLPLKLLIPLVIFILPPLFIVLIGPAAISLMESLSGSGL